jgi:hypothetical protein
MTGRPPERKRCLCAAMFNCSLRRLIPIGSPATSAQVAGGAGGVAVAVGRGALDTGLPDILGEQVAKVTAQRGAPRCTPAAGVAPPVRRLRTPGPSDAEVLGRGARRRLIPDRGDGTLWPLASSCCFIHAATSSWPRRRHTVAARYAPVVTLPWSHPTTRQMRSRRRNTSSKNTLRHTLLSGGVTRQQPDNPTANPACLARLSGVGNCRVPLPEKSARHKLLLPQGLRRS